MASPTEEFMDDFFAPMLLFIVILDSSSDDDSLPLALCLSTSVNWNPRSASVRVSLPRSESDASPSGRCNIPVPLGDASEKLDQLDKARLSSSRVGQLDQLDGLAHSADAAIGFRKRFSGGIRSPI
ncbi:unnamed protein product [Brassica rapa]|uniref:Uncharacterized protein n=1 Tax=Brassica campestris TaxID=3711 RepID=A0A3P6BLR4_BRACM|nr:unnamed protein product [Brassica rapa]VDD03416.1 unnamed protein product [Brassica rapa]